MSRARVNLEDVKSVSKAVSVAQSTATTTVVQTENSVKNNISTLESASQQVETVLSTCNRSITQLQKMCADAEKRLNALKKELLNTPSKIEKRVTGEDGETKIVKKDNPRYIELQREISALTRKISEYKSLISNFTSLANDCSKQKEALSSAIRSLTSICDALRAVKDQYETKCENAIQRLSDISEIIEEYTSVRIQGGQGSSVSYSAPVTKSGGFGAFVKNTVAIGSMASAIVSPVTAVSSGGMSGLVEQQQEAYHNLDLKKKKEDAETETELATNENNTPKITTPVQPTEDISVTVTENGQTVIYSVKLEEPIDVTSEVENKTEYADDIQIQNGAVYVNGVFSHMQETPYDRFSSKVETAARNTGKFIAEHGADVAKVGLNAYKMLEALQGKPQSPPSDSPNVSGEMVKAGILVTKVSAKQVVEKVQYRKLEKRVVSDPYHNIVETDLVERNTVEISDEQTGNNVMDAEDFQIIIDESPCDET